jgi:hypothetical protein
MALLCGHQLEQRRPHFVTRPQSINYVDTRNGLVAVGVAPFGIWLAAVRAKRLGRSPAHATPVSRSAFWLIAALTIFLGIRSHTGKGYRTAGLGGSKRTAIGVDLSG